MEDNKGLAEPINDLEKVFKDNSHHLQMTRADFWAIASIVAIEEGIVQANIKGKSVDPEYELIMEEPIIFTPGRKDCPTSPNTAKKFKFPHPHMNNSELFEYFNKHFQFSPFQTTSLMAAHNLGKMTKANSGFTAPAWAFDPQTFDDNYYHVMVEKSYVWTQIVSIN